jgi:hypothetical protein
MINDENGNDDYVEVFDVFDNNTTNDTAVDLTMVDLSIDNSSDAIFASLELLAGTCIVDGTRTTHNGGVDDTIFGFAEETI